MSFNTFFIIIIGIYNKTDQYLATSSESLSEIIHSECCYLDESKDIKAYFENGKLKDKEVIQPKVEIIKKENEFDQSKDEEVKDKDKEQIRGIIFFTNHIILIIY